MIIEIKDPITGSVTIINSLEITSIDYYNYYNKGSPYFKVHTASGRCLHCDCVKTFKLLCRLLKKETQLETR